MTYRTKLLISIFLVLLGVAGRLLPHLWNMTPIVAIALVATVYLGWRWSVGIILATMLLSDAFIGFYSFPIMISVYGSFAFIGLFGYLVKRYKTIDGILVVSVLSSTLFYLITNWAVWKFGAMYDPSLSGLIQSYAMAVPFYKNAIVGDVVHTVALFGVFESVSYFLRQTSFQKMRQLPFLYVKSDK
jgi:hypothetical protein